MFHGRIVSSRDTPPRVGDIIFAQSECGKWFHIKVLGVSNNGSVRAQVIPSDLERYRKAWNNPHATGEWVMKLKYHSYDANDIEFHKR